MPPSAAGAQFSDSDASSLDTTTPSNSIRSFPIPSDNSFQALFQNTDKVRFKRQQRRQGLVPRRGESQAQYDELRKQGKLPSAAGGDLASVSSSSSSEMEENGNQRFYTNATTSAFQKPRRPGHLHHHPHHMPHSSSSSDSQDTTSANTTSTHSSSSSQLVRYNGIQQRQPRSSQPDSDSDAASVSSSSSADQTPRATRRRGIYKRGMDSVPDSMPAPSHFALPRGKGTRSTTTRSISRSAAPSTSPRRVIRDGRLVKTNRDYLVGKRSNVVVDKRNLQRDAFGRIDPTQYFGQIYEKKEPKNAFFMDSDVDSTTSGSTSMSEYSEWSATDGDFPGATLTGESSWDDYSDSSYSTANRVSTFSRTGESRMGPTGGILAGSHRIHRVPKESVRGILQNSEAFHRPAGENMYKQTRFADEIRSTSPSRTTTTTTAAYREQETTSQDAEAIAVSSSPTPSKRPRISDEFTTPHQQEENNHETGASSSGIKQMLFSKPMDVTKTPDLSSPPPPNVSFELDDLPSSPGDRSSFHSIPAQEAYSPDLGQLGDTTTKTTIHTSNNTTRRTHGETTGHLTSADLGRPSTSHEVSASPPPPVESPNHYHTTTTASPPPDLSKSPRTASLLRTPSDDEDTAPSTILSRKRKRSSSDLDAPPPPLTGDDNFFAMGDASSIDLGLDDSRRHTNPVHSMLGGELVPLTQTPRTDKRLGPRATPRSDESIMQDESGMAVSPNHIYKPIRYDPQYTAHAPDEEEIDAEYIEKHEDNLDETYLEPNQHNINIPRRPRRSKRTRLPPMRKWMNERADATTKQIVIPRTPRPKRRRQSKRLTAVDENQGHFNVKSGSGQTKRKFIAASKNMIRDKMTHYAYRTYEDKPATQTGQGKMSISNVFSKDVLRAGTIIMHGGSVKPRRNSGAYRHIYTVISGTAEVVLGRDGNNPETFRVDNGSMFYIPPNNDFVLKNPQSKAACTLSFVLSKVT